MITIGFFFHFQAISAWSWAFYRIMTKPLTIFAEAMFKSLLIKFLIITFKMPQKSTILAIIYLKRFRTLMLKFRIPTRAEFFIPVLSDLENDIFYFFKRQDNFLIYSSSNSMNSIFRHESNNDSIFGKLICLINEF